MNKLGFVETDKNVILSNYKKAKDELQNVYNKYGFKVWNYNEMQKKELNDVMKKFNSAKGKCMQLGIRI
jgi:uncharacterized protein (UPF0333 family)